MRGWVCFGIGAAGGAVLAAGLWAVFSNRLDAQIRTTLDTELGPRVGAEIDSKLSAVGITRQTGEQLGRLLSVADDIGLIGIRGTTLSGQVPLWRSYPPILSTQPRRF